MKASCHHSYFSCHTICHILLADMPQLNALPLGGVSISVKRLSCILLVTPWSNQLHIEENKSQYGLTPSGNRWIEICYLIYFKNVIRFIIIMISCLKFWNVFLNILRFEISIFLHQNPGNRYFYLSIMVRSHWSEPEDCLQELPICGGTVFHFVFLQLNRITTFTNISQLYTRTSIVT